MFAYDTYSALLEKADAPLSSFDELSDLCNDAHSYGEAFVDHVPRNRREAIETVRLAAELVPAIAEERVRNELDRRTVETLINLRRLEREAREQDDMCDPPLRREERVLRSLIAFMARPVLVSE